MLHVNVCLLTWLLINSSCYNYLLYYGFCFYLHTASECFKMQSFSPHLTTNIMSEFIEQNLQGFSRINISMWQSTWETGHIFYICSGSLTCWWNLNFHCRFSYKNKTYVISLYWIAQAIEIVLLLVLKAFLDS